MRVRRISHNSRQKLPHRAARGLEAASCARREPTALARQGTSLITTNGVRVAFLRQDSYAHLRAWRAKKEGGRRASPIEKKKPLRSDKARASRAKEEALRAELDVRWSVGGRPLGKGRALHRRTYWPSTSPRKRPSCGGPNPSPPELSRSRAEERGWVFCCSGSEAVPGWLVGGGVGCAPDKKNGPETLDVRGERRRPSSERALLGCESRSRRIGQSWARVEKTKANSHRGTSIEGQARDERGERREKLVRGYAIFISHTQRDTSRRMREEKATSST